MLRTVADEFWEAYLQDRPTWATIIGDHRGERSIGGRLIDEMEADSQRVTRYLPSDGIRSSVRNKPFIAWTVTRAPTPYCCPSSRSKVTR